MLSKWIFLLFATVVMSQLNGDGEIRKTHHVSRYWRRLCICVTRMNRFMNFFASHKDCSKRTAFSADTTCLKAAGVLWKDCLHGRIAVPGLFDLCGQVFQIKQDFSRTAIQRNNERFWPTEGHSQRPVLGHSH